MPNGKIHDAITLLLAAPSFAVTYLATKNISASVNVAAAFVFGGLMFGPDLDTASRQYSRWFIFRFIWFPYRSFFKHRSRFSHGLILGALIRVIYFMGGLTLVAFAVIYVETAVIGGKLPAINDISLVWAEIGDVVGLYFGRGFFLLIFIGLWLGAASHTFTDMAGSYIKTGRLTKFL